MKTTIGAHGGLSRALREAADDMDGVAAVKPYYVQMRELPTQMGRHNLGVLEGMRHARRYNGDTPPLTDDVLNRKGQGTYDQVRDLANAWAQDTGGAAKVNRLDLRIATAMLREHKRREVASVIEQNAATEAKGLYAAIGVKVHKATDRTVTTAAMVPS